MLKELKNHINIELDPRIKKDNPSFYEEFTNWWGKKKNSKKIDLWCLPHLKIQSVLSPNPHSHDFCIGVLNTNLDFEFSESFINDYVIVLDQFKVKNLESILSLYLEQESKNLINTIIETKIMKNIFVEKKRQIKYPFNFSRYYTITDIDWNEFSKAFNLPSIKVLKKNQFIGHEIGQLVSLDDGQEYFLWIEQQNKNPELNEIIKDCIYQLQPLINRSLSIDFIEHEIKLTTEQFEFMDKPYLFVSPDGQLFHNQLFSILNLTQDDCARFQDKTSITIAEKKFIFHKLELGPAQILYVFVPYEVETDVYNEELGVIASSLAHELNNPIAGMLGACTILKMDIKPENEEYRIIDNMSNSLMRSKELVQILLGFSKYSIDSNTSADQKAEVCFFNANKLIRHRLLEANTKLSFDYQASSSLEFKNTHLLTMFFYMLMSEYVTLCHHQSLIVNINQAFSFKVKEKKNELSINLEFADDIDKALFKNSLFNYIQSLLGFKRVVFDKKLLFINETLENHNPVHVHE